MWNKRKYETQLANASSAVFGSWGSSLSSSPATEKGKKKCSRKTKQTPPAIACSSVFTAWEQRPACRWQLPNICCWWKTAQQICNKAQIKHHQPLPAQPGPTVLACPFPQSSACRNNCQMCALVQKQALTNVEPESFASSVSHPTGRTSSGKGGPNSSQTLVLQRQPYGR